MTPLDLDGLAKRHHLPEFGDWDAGQNTCHECGDPMPCPTSTLIEVVRIAREALAITHQASCSAAWVGEFPPTGLCNCESGDALIHIDALVDLGEPT